MKQDRRFIFNALLGPLILMVALAASSYAADYSAEFVSQTPEGLNLPYLAGQTATFQLSYKNTGTVYWNNTRNVSDPHSIELRCVTAADSIVAVNSPLYPGQGPSPLWVNRQRVVGPSQTRVDPGQTADFVFTVTMPSSPGTYRVFFRPVIYGNFLAQGRYFDLQVTQPSILAPSNLVALADGLSVDLAWQDNSDNEDGFHIEKKMGNTGAYFPLVTLPAGANSYRDTDVVANWRYFYRVRSFKGSDVSIWIEYYAQVLAPPGNLSAAVKSQTEIDLQWTDNTLGETGFKVYRKSNPGDPWQEIADLTPQTATYTSYSDTGLAFDTTFYYGVRAYANSTTLTPHFSAFAATSARTQGLSAEPNWVKNYRLVRAANGRQDHLYTTSLDEKNAAEAAGYMFDGEDFMVSSVPFVGSHEVVRLRKNGPGYVIRLYTTSTAEITSVLAQGYVQEFPSLGYVYAMAHLGTAEIKRCFHAGITDRFYTAYPDEYAAALASGYQAEHSLGYAPRGAGRAPIRPTALAPASSPCVAIPPTLQASPFNDPDPGDSHAASSWQATPVQGNYAEAGLILSRVDDTQNLTTIIPDANRLSKGKRYWWRVRYKDASGLRSSWSQEASFMARCYDPSPIPLTVDGPALEQRNCKGHYQKFSFQVQAGKQYVVTLTPTEGDPDLYGSKVLSHLDQLPHPPVGTMKSCRAPGLVERLTIQADQNGTFYAAGYGATESAYRISVSTSARAVIAANRRDVISGGTVRFDGTGSTPSGSGGTIVSYVWTFSDGTTKTGPVVDHVFHYSAGGTQSVTLTITDSSGSSSQSSLAVSVTGSSQGTTANHSGHSSDPVNMATGNFTYSHTDLVVPGQGLPFVFTRSYNSRDPFFRTGRPLGHGWTHSFNLKILQDSESQVTVIFPDGHGVIFTAAGNGTYTPEKGFHHRLEQGQAGGGYRLTTKEQVRYVFDGNHRLERIEDRNGNTIRCEYDGAGKLVRIIDTVGRIFKLSYDPAGRLTTLTDPIGRVLRYGYSGSADLASFTDPEENTTGYGYDGLHQMTTVTDPRGVLAVHMVYDELSRVVRSQSDVYGNAFLFSYDFETGITVQKDPMGHETVYVHDDQMRLVSLKHPDGYAEYFEYDEEGNRVGVIDRRGNTTRYDYDERGNVTAKHDSSGSSVTLEYDGMNNPVRRTDPLGGITEYLYDDNGNLVRLIDPAGYETLMEYDAHGRLIAKTDAKNHTTGYEYDDDGNLVEVEDPLGALTFHEYDGVGRKVASTDPGGRTTLFVYDKNDRLVSVTDPSGHTSRFQYDAAGNRTVETDPLDRLTRYDFDLKNRPARTVDPAGGVSTLVYNAVDQVTRKTLPLNNAWSTDYNPVGKPSRQKNPLGHETLLAYDPDQNLEARTDPTGRTTHFSYDEQSRLIATRDPLGSFERIEYDAAGRVVRKIDPLGRSTSFEYDPLGRLVSVTDAAGSRTAYEYDPVGNLIAMITPSGAETVMEYDGANRLVRRIDPMGREETFSYDLSGRLMEKTHPDGSATAFEYDASGRLTRILYQDGEEVSFEYDGAGNRVAMEDSLGTGQWDYDEKNRVTRYRYNGLDVGYAYDLNGNRTAIVYPDGKTVRYRYDPADRLAEVEDWLGRITRYTYDGAGRLKSVLLPNGATAEYSYDPAGRLNAVANRLPGGALVSSHQFTLDRAGNILVENGVSPLDPLTEPADKDYIYDASNRLLEAGEALFYYDERGNLVRKDEDGIPSEYVFTAADRLALWQREGQNAQFGYDGLGNRITRTQGGSTTRYVWDLNAPLPRIIAETDSEGAITRYHIYGLGLIGTITASGEVALYHYDHRGNTLAVTNLQGEITAKYAYDDFGRVANQWNGQDNPFRFLGRYGVMAEDSLYHIRARYYDPDTGRFISPDPVKGNLNQPQTLNAYVYTLNNPIRFIDISGFSSVQANRMLEQSRKPTDKDHQLLVEDLERIIKELIKEAISSGILAGGKTIIREIPWLKVVPFSNIKADAVKHFTKGFLRGLISGLVRDSVLRQYYIHIEGGEGEDAPFLISLIPGTGGAKSAGGDLDPNDPHDAALLEFIKNREKKGP